MEPSHLDFHCLLHANVCPSLPDVQIYPTLPYGIIWESSREKPDLQVNNKGADQSVHPHSLISAFVIHSLISMVVSIVTCKLSGF